MMAFRSFYSVLAACSLIPLLIGSVPPMISADTPHPPTATVLPPLQAGQQGIAGQVRRLTGDHMPSVQDPELGQQLSQSQSHFVQTEVWIFSGRIMAKGTRWPIDEAAQHPQLVGQVSSDGQGKFSVSLPSGEYTLLAQYGSDLYLNAFLSDGSYATLQVNSGKVTSVDLVNREDATF